MRSTAKMSGTILPDGEQLTPPQPSTVSAETISAVDAVRAFSVMTGPSALFDLFLLTSVIATIRRVLFRPYTTAARRPHPLVALGTALAVVYPTVIRPWMLGWGASDQEKYKPLPGDNLVANPLTTSTRAITVEAPVEAVWPWLAQIGQDRGGFYSYEWLENLAGCKMHNADSIHPEWQQRAIGDMVKLHWALGNRVACFEPNHAMVLEGWGAFVVEPQTASRCRVILRSRTKRGWSALYEVLLIELPHFLMERQMLLGLKKRAEHGWRQRFARMQESKGEAS
jgi:hypothetical protein